MAYAYSAESRARIRAAVVASNKRRGEQDPMLRLARSRFRQAIANAKIREVAWRLTFEEWWAVWSQSGKWLLRGKGVGRCCMSRYGDEGAYETGNVFINLFSENTREGVTGLKRTPEQNASRSLFMKGNRNSVGRTVSAETREKRR